MMHELSHVRHLFGVLPVEEPGHNTKARESQKAESEMALPFLSIFLTEIINFKSHAGLNIGELRNLAPPFRNIPVDFSIWNPKTKKAGPISIPPLLILNINTNLLEYIPIKKQIP
jgi:hypothetical protein